MKKQAQLETTDCGSGGNPKIPQTPAKILEISVNTTQPMNLLHTQECQHLTDILVFFYLHYS